MSVEFLLVATLVASVPNNIVTTAKVGPNIGANWYVPASTGAPLTKALSSGDVPSPYTYNTVFNAGQNGQSSFVPTSNLLNSNQVATAIESNNQANYVNAQGHQLPPRDSVQGNHYQYLQYHPEGNAYHMYPVDSTEPAEQRQEFLDPNSILPDGGGDDGGSILGGITGTASNIAQAIGLGGLGVLGSILVLLVGGPLIVFAILFPVAILIIAILGFPVLQLTLPPSDPNLGRMLKSKVIDGARKAREVLQSEECVERFSCALARKSRTLPYENWILEKMDKVSNRWANRVSKSVKAGRAGENCQRFKCTPVTKMKTMYETFSSSTAKFLRQTDII